MPQETIIPFLPAPFVPSISFGGTEPQYIIRGQNLWLKAKSKDTMYAVAYKGSYDVSQTIDTYPLGNVSWVSGSTTVTGTAFRTALKPGSFISVNLGAVVPASAFFVIEEVISDTSARVSRAFTDTQTNMPAYVLPIAFPLGTKVATQIRGNSVKFPRGHFLGVGLGELKLNGQSLLVRQVETLTVLGTTATGAPPSINVTVVAIGMAGTGVPVNVVLVVGDTPTIIAQKITTAMKATAGINAFFTITNHGAVVTFIAKTGAANDATMNISYTLAGGTGGITAVASSANTVVGNKFELSKTPVYAMYDPATNSYSREEFGISLPDDDPSSSQIISLGLQSGGTKGMPNVFAIGVRVVAYSDPLIGGTGGFSQPSANYRITTTAAGQKIRITFNKPMRVDTGQNSYQIFVTRYGDATADNTINNISGPWFRYENVSAAQLATENSVSDGTVPILHHDIEFADGELEAVDELLSFDNFDPYEAEFVDLIASEAGITPIFFSSLGQRTSATAAGTAPGPAVVLAKPDNPEAILRDVAVATFESDTILGVVNARGRHWLLCESSLQTAIQTGVVAAPITIRSFWDVGFRNPFNVKFFKDYLFGHSTGGFLRSIGVGDTSDVDFEFSSPIDDYVTDWITSHVLTAYDPKNKAICFFFSGRERQSNRYVTLVLPFLPNQNIWNPPILLKHATRDFIVSGVATVGQSLYFVAGGVVGTSDPVVVERGTVVMKTYEFDRADGVALDCYAAWAFTDMGQEDSPQAVRGVASFVGNGASAKVEIHGVSDNGTFSLTTLETGHGNAPFTIDMGTTSGFGRKGEKRQNVDQYSKWTARLSFQSTDGSGRFDELNLLVNQEAAGSRK